MKIQTEDVVATRNGPDGIRISETVKLIICPACGHKTFFTYLVGVVNHLHFQCVECDASFCDGSCSEETN